MKGDSSPIHTYQTRVELSAEESNTLAGYASLMSKVVRSLFAMAMSGKAILSLKNGFLKRFGITARQFNACRVQLQGKIESVRQLNILHIQELKTLIAKRENKLNRHRSARMKGWYHRQRLMRLRKRLARLEEDRASGRVRICFGSRKRFRRQFTGEQSHSDWKRDWEEQRNREFFILGSKDETTGNQSCKATVADDGSLSLRLRLPDALDQGKYLTLHTVRFAYGHSTILAALKECQLRADLAKEKDPLYKQHGQAISYRFVRDRKGWRVFASTALPKPKWITDQRLGVIGLDINVDHLAIVETDRYGNPIARETIPCTLYGLTHNQARAVIGDAAVRAVKIASRAKKPLIVEQLDFTKKKSTLQELNPKRARMLSSFAYSAILQALRSRAYRQAVELFDVNPAFTSLLGRIKYATRYGLTTHHAAALCIARRHQGFSESLPSQSSVPDGKGGHIAFSVPVRNQEKHEWYYLKRVARNLRAALVGHFRVALCQSSDPPWIPCDAKSSKIVGAIPTREPLAIPFG